MNAKLSFRTQPSLTIGVLNLMPSVDRAATEAMFNRRFASLPFPVEIVWLHPDAERLDFRHTAEIYQTPSPSVYDRIDYLFRTGADVEFVAPEDNRFLQSLRRSLAFDKGSTSLCWSAGQIYADLTGQKFSDFLIGRDEQGKAIKRSGYFGYSSTAGCHDLDIPNESYMACSRHFTINARDQLGQAYRSGFKPIAIAESGYDTAGFVKGRDILLFTHNEYDPARLYYETERCIDRAQSEAEKSWLRAQFPEFRSKEQAADRCGETLFHSILQQALKYKYAWEPSVEKLTIRAYV